MVKMIQINFIFSFPFTRQGCLSNAFNQKEKVIDNRSDAIKKKFWFCCYNSVEGMDESHVLV